MKVTAKSPSKVKSDFQQEIGAIINGPADWRSETLSQLRASSSTHVLKAKLSVLLISVRVKGLILPLENLILEAAKLNTSKERR